MASSLSLPMVPGAGAADEVSGLRRWATTAILGCYLIGAVAVTARLWAEPATRMVAGNPNDNDFFAWMIRNSAIAVAHGRLPSLITAGMNAPQGISLMWNNSLLLPGVLLAPVTLLFGPQTTLTVLLAAGFAGSAASMLLVLRRWDVSLSAAGIGGAVYGFSPALVHSAIGHYNLQFAVLPPVLVHLGLRLCTGTRRPLWIGALLGLLAAAQLFISAELLLDTAIAGVLMALVLAGSRPRAIADHVRDLSLGLCAAGGAMAVLAGWPLWIQFFGPLTERGSAFLFDFYKNDLSSFITPSSLLLFHTSASAAAAARYQGGAPEYLAYLGVPLIIALAVAAVAGWRRLPIRATAVALAVLELLSLGVHPMIGGTVQAGITLPWRWFAHLPVLSAALPDRLSVVADAAAAALLAFAIDAVRARVAPGTGFTALVTAAGALVALPLLPLPLPIEATTSVPPGWSQTVDELNLPAAARVLTVPVPTPTITQAMRWQAQTGEQISLNGGYFQGPGPAEQAYMEGNGLPSLALYLDELWTGSTPGLPPTSAAAAGALAFWRPSAVVADVGPNSALRRYLVGLFGQPTVSNDGVLGWNLVR